MKTRIEPSAIVGGFNLVSERTDKVLLFGESFTVCSNVQAQLEATTDPTSEAAEVAAFIADWSGLL
jgi:hypothetical protein